MTDGSKAAALEFICRLRRRNVAAVERSDNVADRSHAFALLKRGYARDRAPQVERVVPNALKAS